MEIGMGGTEGAGAGVVDEEGWSPPAVAEEDDGAAASGSP